MRKERERAERCVRSTSVSAQVTGVRKKSKSRTACALHKCVCTDELSAAFTATVSN